MKKKDLATYKRKYQSFRHHAWAGLGFLSIAFALRLLFPDSFDMLTPVIFILVIYIVVALIFTYVYRAGLSAEEKAIQIQPSVEIEKAKINADVEKERLKTEKKKAKAESKKTKKAKK